MLQYIDDMYVVILHASIPENESILSLRLANTPAVESQRIYRTSG